MFKIFAIAFIIYTYYFIKLGNTVFRLNNNNKVTFNLSSLLIEGFIGPLRTIYYLLIYSGFLSTVKFIWFEFFRLSNPYSALFFTYYIFKIILVNF